MRRRAHPRSRGENPSPAREATAAAGSSPLTRGKCGPPGRWRGRSGLIPAHAGKIGDVPSHCEVRRAHPRSRGENGRLAMRALTGAGSSPLTRGKSYQPGETYEKTGLIPAHAGKMRPVVGAGALAWAHPRSRGENARVAGCTAAAGGSSPLTRGKLVHQADPVCGRGLIPAHAGKMSRSGCQYVCARAHPRSRGEN